MATQSLWGEFDLAARIKTPAAILREQASHLETITGGVLSARVDAVQQSNDALFTEFKIVAPLLGGYRYTILEVVHDLDIFPLKIVDLVHETEIACHDEEEFLAELGKVLASQEVKIIIETLISQSRAASNGSRPRS
jgi:hypothetical protein